MIKNLTGPAACSRWTSLLVKSRTEGFRETTESKKWKSKSFFGLGPGFGANDVTDFADDANVNLWLLKASRLNVTDDDAAVDIGSKEEHIGGVTNVTRRTNITATMDMMTI